MQVQRINLMTQNQNIKSISPAGLNRRAAIKNNPDKISFTGYQETLAKYAGKSFEDSVKLKAGFMDIFNSLTKENDLWEAAAFQYIKGAYLNNGLTGFLKKLMYAPTGNKLSDFVPKEVGSWALLKKNGNPLFSIYNGGALTYMDILRNPRKIPGYMAVRYSSPDGKDIMEFHMNKKSGIELRSIRDNIDVWAEYYPEGKLKQETVFYDIYAPETTYYNKDGSKAFWKNFLYGGVATPMYM